MLQRLLLFSCSSLLALCLSALQPHAARAQDQAVDHHTAPVAAFTDVAVIDELTRIEWNDNQQAAGELTDGRLLLDLEVRRGIWRPLGEEGDSVVVLAFAEVGKTPRIPGPLIRVPAVTEVVATVTNPLDVPLEVQGLSSRVDPDFGREDVRNYPGEDIPSIVINPGESRELRFTAEARGTYFYRGYADPSPTAPEPFESSMLAGAFVVEGPEEIPPENEKILVVQAFFGDSMPGGQVDEAQELLTINGRPWPHTERLTYDLGDTITWRVINASGPLHPMHLHGFFYEVLSRGDLYQDSIYRPTQVRQAVTERMDGFTTMMLRWTPDRPGGWIFHCHLANHVMPNPGLTGELPTQLERMMAVIRDDGSHDPAAHMSEAMGGLLMAIEVRAPDGWAPERAQGEPLRVHVREDSVPGHALPRFGFALGGPGEPPPPGWTPFPSPPLVLPGGEPMAVRVVNDTDEPTTTHWHGLEVESLYDGVAGLAGHGDKRAPVVMPGDSFDVVLRTDRPGTYIYHTHTADLRQQSAGLYAPLIILPEGQERPSARDRVFIAGLGSGEDEELTGDVYLNGWREPETMQLIVGEEYRLRLINITLTRGDLEFRLTRDGYPVQWRPLEKDAWRVPLHQQDRAPARQPVSVGETYDFTFTALEEGDLKMEIRSGTGNLLVAQDVHAFDPGPLSMPKPEAWNAGSVYTLPPPFAPDITHEGVLQFRFAPGMFEAESEERFSYVMGWWIKDGPALDRAELERLLEVYFTGLAQDESASDVQPGVARASVRTDPGEDELWVIGTVETFDFFATEAPETLHVRGRLVDCTAAEGQALLLELSPQPLEHEIWEKLQSIQREGRC